MSRRKISEYDNFVVWLRLDGYGTLASILLHCTTLDVGVSYRGLHRTDGALVDGWDLDGSTLVEVPSKYFARLSFEDKEVIKTYLKRDIDDEYKHSVHDVDYESGRDYGVVEQFLDETSLLSDASLQDFVNASKSLVDLIRGEEQHFVECKESLEEPDPLHKTLVNVPLDRLAEKMAEARKNVLHSALKSICAFRNSPSGGTLLIGVKDDRAIIGLGRDYAAYQSSNPRDTFLQKLAPALKVRFSPALTGLIHPEFIEINDVDVCRIDVKPGPPCYLDGKLYVRNLSTTEAQEGPALEAWLKGRGE